MFLAVLTPEGDGTPSLTRGALHGLLARVLTPAQLLVRGRQRRRVPNCRGSGMRLPGTQGQALLHTAMSLHLQAQGVGAHQHVERRTWTESRGRPQTRWELDKTLDRLDEERPI